MNKKLLRQRERRKQNKEQRFEDAKKILEEHHAEWDFKKVTAKQQFTLKDNQLPISALHHWEFLRELRRKCISNLSNNFMHGMMAESSIVQIKSMQDRRELRGIIAMMRGLDYDLLQYEDLLPVPYPQLDSQTRTSLEERAGLLINSQLVTIHNHSRKFIPKKEFKEIDIKGEPCIMIDTSKLYEELSHLQRTTFVLSIDWNFSNSKIFEELMNQFKLLRPKGWKYTRHNETEVIRAAPYAYKIRRFLIGMAFQRIKDITLKHALKLRPTDIIRIYYRDKQKITEGYKKEYRRATNEYRKVMNIYLKLLRRREELCRGLVLPLQNSPPILK